MNIVCSVCKKESHLVRADFDCSGGCFKEGDIICEDCRSAPVGSPTGEQSVNHTDWCTKPDCDGICEKMVDRIKRAARKTWDAIADDVIRGSCDCSGTSGIGSRCCETVVLSKGEVIDIVSDQMCGGGSYAGDDEACKYFFDEMSYEHRRELLSEEFTCSSYGY